MWSIEAANLFSVKGLVAVVTGGGSGIGLMMAKALEANGAKVYIIGRRLETLEAAAKQSQYANIIPLQGDVTNKDDLTKIVEKITAEDGFINVLIANSGITGPTVEKLKPEASISEFRNNLWASDPDDFTHTYKVNTSGVFFSVVAFLELLDAGNKKGNVEQKSQVIATSAIGAFSRVSLSSYAYGTSKAAVVDLMKKFATSLVPYNIRSNVIAPGLFPSEMADNLIETLTADGKKIESSVIPLERPGSLEDMAGATLFLTSRAGAYLSGNVIVTDGGRLGVIPSTY